MGNAGEAKRDSAAEEEGDQAPMPVHSSDVQGQSPVLVSGVHERGRTADVACLLGDHADGPEEVALGGAYRTGRLIHPRSPTAHPATSLYRWR